MYSPQTVTSIVRKAQRLNAQACSRRAPLQSPLAPPSALGVIGLCLLASLLWSACAAPHRPTPVVATSASEPEERLGVDDVFEVRVYGDPELSGLYRVTSEGNIDFPYVGRLAVANHSSSEVQSLITEKLRDGYLRNPQVTVMVKEWNSRKVSVLGQVQKPGPVTYFPRMTIVDAIAAAGGFTSIAAKNSVTLTRQTRSGPVQTRSYPVADISEGRSSNVVLLPGDVLVVEERLF